MERTPDEHMELFGYLLRKRRAQREPNSITQLEFDPKKTIKREKQVVSKHLEEYRRGMPKYMKKAKKRGMHDTKQEVTSKLDKVEMKQEKLNDALQTVQDFMDKAPNFTNIKTRTKAKELQQALLRSSESQEVYLRGLLEKVRKVREFEQKRDMARVKNNRCLLMKLLQFQAQTLPLWVSTVKQPYAPSGVGACALDENRPIAVGDLCAAFYGETWILAQVLHSHAGGKYDLRDVDRKEKVDQRDRIPRSILPRMRQLQRAVAKINRRAVNPGPTVYHRKLVPIPFRELKATKKRWSRLLEEEAKQHKKWSRPRWNIKKRRTRKPRLSRLDGLPRYWPLPRTRRYKLYQTQKERKVKPVEPKFTVFRKRLISLPQYRADPTRDIHALFPSEAIVLALYPQTTCFYKGVIIRPPQTATDEYMISFEDKVYPSGWSPPSRVQQRYVVTYKEIKSHKKKMNFDEMDD